MPPKIYKSEAERKAADAKRKANKRAADKEANGIPIRPKFSKTENAERRKLAQRERMKSKRAHEKLQTSTSNNNDVPKSSQKDVRKKADANRYALKKATETTEQKTVRLANQKERQQKLRDAWTSEQRQSYNSKKNDYQIQKRAESNVWLYKLVNKIAFNIPNKSEQMRRKETDQAYALRLHFQGLRQEKLRSLELPEKKDARQKSDRIYQQQRRLTINKHVDEYFNQKFQNGRGKYKDDIQAHFVNVWKKKKDSLYLRLERYRESLSEDQAKNIKQADADHQREKRSNETKEEKQKRLENRRQWNWENCVEIQKQVKKYEHSDKGRAKIEERKEKLQNEKAARKIDEAFLKGVIDSIIQDPQIGNEENFPSHEPFSSPEVMRENKEYIRKKRPINFTMADLEADIEEDYDAQYEINIPASSGAVRKLPKRSCSKQIVHENTKNSSEDDELENEALNESTENDDTADESVGSGRYSPDIDYGSVPEDDELEKQLNLNESAQNFNKNEIVNWTEAEYNDETGDEEYYESDGSGRYSPDIDYVSVPEDYL